MSRLALLIVSLLVAAASAKTTPHRIHHHHHHQHHHHHHKTHKKTSTVTTANTADTTNLEAQTAEFAFHTGYTANMVLPDTVADIKDVSEADCEAACTGKCYGVLESKGKCFTLFVDAGKSFALPSDGDIAWNFAARDCTSGTHFIDFTGACEACPANTVTTSDGTGCTSEGVTKTSPLTPVRAAAVQQPASGDTSDSGTDTPVGTNPAGRFRQRMLRRARVDREIRREILGAQSL